MVIKYYILFLLLVCSLRVGAQALKFTSSASKNEVGTGEQFEVTFSVNGNAESFSPPNFNNFQVVGGPNQSTSMESVNGSMTVNSSVSYELMAVKEGEFTIGPASIVVNGRRITTNPIKIKVVKGRPAPQNNSGQNAPDNNVAEGKPGELSKSLLLRAIVDKSSAYLGEQVTLTYRIYTRIPIVQSQLDKLPDLTGFFNQEVKQPQQQVQWRVETYKGQRYNVADIKQIILFPEHEGNITIDPFEMTFIVRQASQSRDIMDQIFGGSFNDVQYKAKSLPVVVHVKPLPIAGKPAGFTGAVGNFSVDASIDRKELKANESLNYKIKVSGSGNIKLLQNPNIAFPADFEKYDPKVQDTVNERASGMAGSRIYNYLLIPRHEGNFTIDPVQFSYFNPATGKYVGLITRSFQIKVNKGTAENNVTAFSGADKQDIKTLDKDIRYIKTGDPGLHSQGDEFFGSGGYYLSLLAGPLLCFGAFTYRNRQQKNNSDIVKVKSRRAGKVAAKHLAAAQKFLIEKNTKEFYEAVSKGLYGYLSDKLNISYANLDKDTIVSGLAAKSLKDGLINQVIDALDLCEMARYAPVTHISQHDVFEKAKTIINNIEDEI